MSLCARGSPSPCLRVFESLSVHYLSSFPNVSVSPHVSDISVCLCVSGLPLMPVSPFTSHFSPISVSLSQRISEYLCVSVGLGPLPASVSPALPALSLSLSPPLALWLALSLSEHPWARGCHGDKVGAGDGARLGSRRQLRRGAAARAAPAAGSERARERERERG